MSFRQISLQKSLKSDSEASIEREASEVADRRTDLPVCDRIAQKY